MATQCQRLDGRINRADDKLKGWQVAQSVLTLLAASIAAFLGSK